MAAHKTNGLLKFVAIPVAVIVVSMLFLSMGHRQKKPLLPLLVTDKTISNTASQDSAAESLDTLTSQWTATEQRVKTIVADNATLTQQNKELLQQVQAKQDKTTADLSQTMDQLKAQMDLLNTHPVPTGNYPIQSGEVASPITTVPELSVLLHPPLLHKGDGLNTGDGFPASSSSSVSSLTSLSPFVPYYTIPANATAVKDRLMTALVGRIPVKGVVTDPYPFKIVFSDDTLAANGLRVPHLHQMIVSGYTEGDLNLVSVRGWVTSLTFVFNDGTISTTTSNENNIGRFTKDDALGYLSDSYGNPFLRGKLITNAPTYVGVNVALGAAEGAANAYAQSQTTTQSTTAGTNTASVTGSPSAFIAGQSSSNAMSQVQQWWHDREEQSCPSGKIVCINLNFPLR